MEKILINDLSFAYPDAPDKLIINESTYRKLEDYLSDGFLEKIEIFLEQ